MKLGDVQMSLKGDKLIKICKMFFKRKEKERIWLKHVQSGKSDKKSPEICLESTTFADYWPLLIYRFLSVVKNCSGYAIQ